MIITMKKSNIGTMYILIAAVVFSLGGLLIKLIPFSPLALASGRCIFSSLVIGLYFYVTKKKIKINKTTIFGALLVILNMLTYIVSNKLTTAANAIVLEYTSSIFIIIFEFLIFKKKPSNFDAIITLIVFIGIAIVFIDGINTDGILGIIIALMGGAIYGLIFLINSFDGGDSTSSVLIGHILCAIINLPFLLQESEFTVTTLTSIAVFGIVQTGFGYLFLSLGTKYCKPLTASLVASIEPILNPIIVAIFYHEYMSPLAIVGATIVIGSVIVYNIFSASMSKKKMG